MRSLLHTNHTLPSALSLRPKRPQNINVATDTKTTSTSESGKPDLMLWASVDDMIREQRPTYLTLTQYVCSSSALEEICKRLGNVSSSVDLLTSFTHGSLSPFTRAGTLIGI